MLASLFKKKTTTTIIYNKSFIYGFFFSIKNIPKSKQNLSLHSHTHIHTRKHIHTNINLA